MPGGTSRSAFLYDNLSLAVSSPVSSHLRWLEDFLLPHFSLGEGTAPPYEVDLKIDGESWRRIGEGFEPSGRISAFSFDSGPRPLPCRQGDDGTLTLRDEGSRAFIRVSRDRRRTTIVAAEDNPRIRIPLMRVLREFAMNSALLGGDFFLHASCLVSGERSVLIAGPKHSGKTTLLMDACLHGGVRWLGNDRIRAGRRRGGWELGGMPVIVSIRKGTLALFPRVAGRVSREGLHSRLAPGEDSGDNPADPAGDGRRGVSPSQFSALVAAEQATEGHRPVVVIPRLTGQPGTFDLRRVPGTEALGQLEDIVFGSGLEAQPTPVFTPGGREAGARGGPPEERLRLFAGEVPFVACSIHRDFSRSPGTAAAWVQKILQEGRDSEAG